MRMILTLILCLWVSAAEARPAVWCGWFLRSEFGLLDKAHDNLNKASEWLRWGHRMNGPCAGCVAVGQHHVGKIEYQDTQGRWIVKQGNPYRYGPDRMRWASTFRSP